MYIHRLALSVLLPPHPSTRVDTPTGLTSNFTSVDIAGIKGMDHHQVEGMATIDSSPVKQAGGKLAKRGTLVHAFSSSPLLARRGAPAYQSSRESGPHSDRSLHLLQKQNTIFSFIENPPNTQEERTKSKGKKAGDSIATLPSSSSSMDVDGEAEGPGLSQQWRGLDIEMLRSRIERLSTLLELSEPGTVPEAGMLASLVDLVSVVCVCMCACVCVCVHVRVSDW